MPTRRRESNHALKREAGKADVERGGRPAGAPDAVVVAPPVRRRRARMFQVYLVVASAGFAVMFFYARHLARFTFDLNITLWMQHWHPLWLDRAMEAISGLGYNPAADILIGSIILVVYLIGLKWEAVMLLVGAVGVWLLDLTVKILVQRHRPTPDLVNVFSPLQDYSFPSGHVLLFTAFFGFLFFLIYSLMRRGWPRMSGLVFLGMLITLIGVSRIYLGMHWASDVIGAYLLGSLWLALTVYLYRKGKRRFFPDQPVAPDQPATRA